VATPAVTVGLGLTAVFLDPPYPADVGREMEMYTHDSADVGHAAQAWAIENGDNPMLRIALCGYESLEMPPDWTMMRWKGKGGFGNQGNGRGKENSHREVIWFSPHCVPERAAQRVLFE